MRRKESSKLRSIRRGRIGLFLKCPSFMMMPLLVCYLSAYCDTSTRRILVQGRESNNGPSSRSSKGAATPSPRVRPATANHRPWTLPQLPHSRGNDNKAFLQECESLLELFDRIHRGGSSSGGGYYDDRNYDGSYYKDEYQRRSSGDPMYANRDYNDFDDDYYDDRGRSDSPGRRRDDGRKGSASSFLSSMPNIIQNGDKRIGGMLLASGMAVTLIGFTLFMNRTLMRLGNLLIIAGVPMFMGPQRTIAFFMQVQKARATACVALGIFLVLIGNPFFGIVLEVFGILNLFGNMFPLVWAFVKNMPIVNSIFTSTNKQSNGQGPPWGKPSNNGGRFMNENEDNADDDYYYYGEDNGSRRNRGSDDGKYY